MPVRSPSDTSFLRVSLVRAAEELGVGRRHLTAWLEGRRESKSLEARARQAHPELLALRKTRRPIEAADGVRLTLADLIAAWRKLTRDEQRRFMVAISTEIATASERSAAHERRPL